MSAPEVPPAASAEPPPASREEAGRASPAELYAPPLAAFLGVLFAWWALAEGAYFPTVSLPGVIAMAAATAVVLIGSTRAAPLRRRVAATGVTAAAALFALAAWSALSALWSPAPDVALGDGLKIAGFGLAFVLGGCVAIGSGGRRELALFPLVTAALVAGAVTAVRLAIGDDPSSLLDTDGTLQAPLGYRNATAAFFLMGLFASVALAASPSVDWRVRGVAGATATLCGGLGIVCQSRGTIPAFALALLVLLLASPLKLRTASWSALVLAPAALVAPAMIDLFQATLDAGSIRPVAQEMNGAGVSVLATSAFSLAACALAARLEGRVPGLGSSSARSNRAVIAAIGAAIACAAVAFVVAVGDPAQWTRDRIDEFRSLETPSFQGTSTRFGLSAGTGRLDFWRVAVEEIGADPLKGAGGGGFQYAYTQDREIYKDARDAHSFELEVASELGSVGLALVAIAILAALAGAVRSKAEGWSAQAVGAAALAVAAYWLVQGSIDWLWSYPVVTSAMFATLGAAGAARLREPIGPFVPPRIRAGFALGALALVAAAAIPPFLSERYIDRAAGLRAEDPGAALQALDRAHELNPLNELPLLVAGEVARLSGDEELARERFEQAIDVRPDEWAGFFYLAVLDARSDRARAESELERARALNPLEPCLENLRAAVRCSSGNSA